MTSDSVMAVPRVVVHLLIFVQSLFLYYAVTRLRDTARWGQRLALWLLDQISEIIAILACLPTNIVSTPAHFA